MIPYTILASASPRRKELLTQAGFSFTVLPALGEEHLTSSLPQEAVKELSYQKAAEIAHRLSDEEFHRLKEQPVDSSFLIIGADTVVSCGESILGKPKNNDDAFSTLSLLQGNTHQVYTGVTVLLCTKNSQSITIQKQITFAEATDVMVYPMTTEEIYAYISTKDGMDKAGSYGIQGSFAIHIRGIKGDYYNVVGLPIARLYQEIKTLF